MSRHIRLICSALGSVVVGVLAWSLVVDTATGQAFDADRFQSFETENLQAAEKRLPEMLDRGTGRILSPPRNEAERYVLSRELYWREQLLSSPHRVEAPHGEGVLLHPHHLSTTYVVTDESGQPVFLCAPASTYIEHPERISGQAGRPAGLVR